MRNDELININIVIFINIRNKSSSFKVYDPKRVFTPYSFYHIRIAWLRLHHINTNIKYHNVKLGTWIVLFNALRFLLVAQYMSVNHGYSIKVE